MPATSAMINSSPTHTTEKVQPRPTTPCGDRRQTLPKSFKGERDKARSADESGIWHTATIVIGILFAASLLSNICLMWYIWKNQSHQLLPIQEANEPDPEQGMLYEKTEEHNSQVA